MSEPTSSSFAPTIPGTSNQPLTSSQYLAQQTSASTPVETASVESSNVDQASATAAYDEPMPGMASGTDDTGVADMDMTDGLDLPDAELQKSRIAPGMYRPQPEITILEWTAPSRPFKKRTKRFFTTVVVIGLLVSLILFFAGQILPVAVVFSIVFLVYVFSVVPPTMVAHKITTFGIHVENELYYWQELGRFWFETKQNQPLVNIESARFPNRLTLLLGDQPEATIRTILAEVLLEEQPPLTQFEKIAKWLEQHIPLDID